MMTSNLLSRLLPPSTSSPSVYETLRQHDQSSDASDVEERAGMAIDEDNLRLHFDADALDQADVAELGESPPMSDQATPFLHDESKSEHSPDSKEQRPSGPIFHRPRWMSNQVNMLAPEEGDDEVPASLLFEGGQQEATGVQTGNQDPAAEPAAFPTSGLSTMEARAQWRTARAQQGLHAGEAPRRRQAKVASKNWRGLTIIDPRQRAIWRWANVDNLDNFLKDVYDYYLGNGIWSIMLNRALNLLTLGFVVGFSTFLTMCIDYKKVPQSKTIAQILISQCTRRMSGLANVLVWLFTLFWLAKLFQYIVDIRRLRHMKDFYRYLLDISDTDIQTISWQQTVTRLMSLRDANPATADGISAKQRRFIGSRSKQRMDAHDIANRLMRKENYLIALFNKDILDLTLPIPFLQHRQLFSKTLEWNLSLCILDYVFNDQGQVRPLFLRDTYRRALSDGLRRRFIFAGFMNVICAPFIVIYLLMLYFFRNFTEYQKNPSQIGSRQYTPLAEWKLREFNELWHLFQRRLNISYPFASHYINQFPKDKTVQLSRFVAFVAGALTSVLALASVIDPELFLGFEITPERTVLFYLGVFGTIWAVARGVLPEETLVFDPEHALNDVIEYTHYRPATWQGRLHSDDVRREFSALYQMKIVIFLEELLSLIFTPFILWFSLPRCSDRLVDFFREFTVHVDGLGYVCSFAVFDFQRGPDRAVAERPRARPATRLREDYYSTKDGKMLASYFGFLDNYSNQLRRTEEPPGEEAASRRQPPPSILVDGSRGLPLPGHVAGVATPPRQRFPPRSKRRSANDPGVLSTYTANRYGRTRLDPNLSMVDSRRATIPAMGASSPLKQRVPLPGRGLESSSTAAKGKPDEDEVALAGSAVMPGPESSGEGGASGEVSHLGESWKTTRAAATNDEGDDEHETGNIDGGPPTGREVGVLGLLYQFQRAQTEGRGGGVTI